MTLNKFSKLNAPYLATKKLNGEKKNLTDKIRTFKHWQVKTMELKGYNKEYSFLFDIESYKLHKYPNFKGYGVSINSKRYNIE